MEMSIEIEVIEESQWVRLVCRGKFETEAFKSVIRRGIQESDDRRQPHVLFDARELAGTPTTIQRYEIATFAADHYIRRQPATPMRFSLLLDPKVIDPEGFGQTVARNRGVPVLVTADEREAMAFLEEGA